MKKTYILDTNVLLLDPRAIFKFEDNRVVLTQTTLQELDSKKIAKGELGFNAREIIRLLEQIKKVASGQNLFNETNIDVFHSGNHKGGTLQIVPDNTDLLPDSFSKEKPDNRIIGTTLYLAQNRDEHVILVTNDISMQINASAAGFCHCESYKNDHISEDMEEYTGLYECDDEYGFVAEDLKTHLVNGVSYHTVEQHMSSKPFSQHKFHENEFVVFNYKGEKTIAIYKSGIFYMVSTHNKGPFGVTPKNIYQIAALHALCAPVQDIPLVILKGEAGTSKTFLSLAAGLATTLDGQYRRLLISRNNVTADAEFGFLPGDINDKMTPLLAPFFDNLENLYRNLEPNESDEEINCEIEDLFISKKMDVCPLAYMRGRSISASYLIVDEAQNATRSQIRDIITRAGKGTKIVLCGDPGQIDTHNLDRYNNGLVYAAGQFVNHNSKLCAQLTFPNETCVRSELSKEAANILRF